jgi:hypothetical protein
MIYTTYIRIDIFKERGRERERKKKHILKKNIYKKKKEREIYI